jgi:phosphatidylserine/phosphatidylglycerophosphate/cardiolipin synthase-like enzyme
VHFSPEGGCENAVVRHIDGAKRSILVQAYSFTNRAITAALIRAHQRQVKVLVILDRSDISSKGSTMEDLRAAQVEVSIDRKHAISHNKVMLFDDHIVLTGSFNFTAAAEHSNAENCLFVADNALAGTYKANWEAHRAHSD